MFTAIRTARLLIRPMRAADAGLLWERRNRPEIARYQTWTLPYPRDEAERVVAAVVAMDGPVDGEWWMATLADPDDRVVLGDVCLQLTWSGRTAEIGYTLDPGHWGRGYAVEAASALAAYAFDGLGVTRVFGMLHPDNTASAMVLERIGMRFEGHTRSSFWVGDEVSDDWIYGMTRPEWQAWRDRPRTPPADVDLAEVTPDNLRAVYALSTHKTQEGFVAPVARSLAQALVPPRRSDGSALRPWYRAITADGEMAGFVMLSLPDPDHPEPYLWRLLVDRRHQRRGIASRALDLVEAEMRAGGAIAITVSYVPGKGSPQPFYEGRGYQPTGLVEDGEVEARKTL